jgi:hypothetical protein
VYLLSSDRRYKKKIDLIRTVDPQFADLSADWFREQ